MGINILTRRRRVVLYAKRTRRVARCMARICLTVGKDERRYYADLRRL